VVVVIDLESLEALAGNATQGKRELTFDDDNRPYSIIIDDGVEKDFHDYQKIVECAWGCATDRGRADYTFIAACSPESIKALIAAVRAAKRFRDECNGPVTEDSAENEAVIIDQLDEALIPFNIGT